MKKIILIFVGILIILALSYLIFGKSIRNFDWFRNIPNTESQPDTDSNKDPDDKIPDNNKPSSLKQNRFGGDLLWYGRDLSRTDATVLSGFSKTLNNLGMGIARFDIYWGMIEKQPGNYDWTLVDQLVNSVPEKEIILTIFSSSQRGSKYNDCRKEMAAARGAELDKVYNGPPSSIPEADHMADYNKFLTALVNRYKNKVKYWQIENEIYGATRNSKSTSCPQVNNFWIGPPEEYVSLLSQSSASIKKADPSAKILAASVAFGSKNRQLVTTFFDYVVKNAASTFDIIDLHFYSDPYLMPERIALIKSKISTKPIWSTETGEIDILFHTDDKFKTSFNSPEELKLQSEEVIKRHVIAFANDIQKVLSLRPTTEHKKESPNVNWNHMGYTFDVEGNQPKPSYYTYQLMVDKLQDFDRVEKLSAGKNVYKFSTEKKNIIVAWDDSGATINLSSALGKDTAKITEIITATGKISPNSYSQPSNSIKLITTPIFIE